jgi:hypothetical protein
MTDVLLTSKKGERRLAVAGIDHSIESRCYSRLAKILVTAFVLGRPFLCVVCTSANHRSREPTSPNRRG